MHGNRVGVVALSLVVAQLVAAGCGGSDAGDGSAGGGATSAGGEDANGGSPANGGSAAAGADPEGGADSQGGANARAGGGAGGDASTQAGGAGAATGVACGNGRQEPDEACDDGNPVAGDGCADCEIERGFACGDEWPSECADVDECALGTDDCGANASCTNEPGGFSCACDDGFAGDGHACTAWSDCGVGQYVATAPTSTSDRSCAPCPKDTYSEQENATSCTAWRACSAGEYVTNAGSSTHDQECGQCPDGTFTSATNATACAAWSVCPAGEYVVAAPTSAADRQCAACPTGTVTASQNAPSCQPAQISAGYAHSCVLRPERSVRCWGSNAFGQLGLAHINTIGDNETPASASDVNVGYDAIQVAAGGNHTCALLADRNLRCWGYNDSGQLGSGNTTRLGDNESPSTALVISVGGAVAQVATGSDHTCALRTNGRVRCWGSGLSGKLGYGNTNNIGDDETPALLGNVPLDEKVVQIAAGAQHTCALLEDQRVRCWGSNLYGELGYAHVKTIGDDETPDSTEAVSIGAPVAQIAAGGTHTCALLTNGNVRCWGRNDRGQLGYGHTNNIGDNEDPASAGDVPVGGPVAQIATGYRHTCALLVNGNVRCWGNGEVGQLGYANTQNVGDDETPASRGDVSVGAPVSRLGLGWHHVCALLSNGHVRCWGMNTLGALGYGHVSNIGDQETPESAGDVAYQ